MNVMKHTTSRWHNADGPQDGGVGQIKFLSWNNMQAASVSVAQTWDIAFSCYLYKDVGSEGTKLISAMIIRTRQYTSVCHFY